MKNNEMIQLTIEVGKCTIPSLPYIQYCLIVKFPQNISAATTYKHKQNDNLIQFGTKLFLRMEKSLFESCNTCSIIVIGLTEKGSKAEIAKGTANPLVQGVQSTKISIIRGQGYLSVLMEFKQIPWQMKQPKTINSRLSNYLKLHSSQKQSSLLLKQQSQKILPSKIQIQKNQGTDSKLKQQNVDKKTQQENTQKQFFIEEQKKQKSNILLNKTNDSQAITLLHSKIYEYQQKFTKQIEKYENKILQYQQKIKKHQQKIHLTNLKLSKYESQIQKDKQKEQKSQEKIKNLEKQITSLKQKLNNLSQTVKSKDLQIKSHSYQTQEISQLLKLQKQKSQYSQKYIKQLNNYVERLLIQNININQVDFIEEKDEILMINQELEIQITSKNVIIEELKKQIICLNNKIAQNIRLSTQNSKNLSNQFLKTHSNNIEVNSTKKLTNNISNKLQLEKTNKVQRKIKKKQQLMIKQIKNKEIDKKVIKNQVKQKQKQKNNANTIKRQIRSVSSKPQIAVNIKSPKAGNKMLKNTAKIQTKIADSQKKSQLISPSALLNIQSDLAKSQNVLLINSRKNSSLKSIQQKEFINL